MGNFNDCQTVPMAGVTTSREERRKAVLAVTLATHTIGDTLQILDMLGLTPRDARWFEGCGNELPEE